MRSLLRWLIVPALVAAAVAGGVVWRRSHKPPAVRYETTHAERGRVVAKVTATGTLSALVTVQVGSQVSGRIQQILVDFNSPVTKGQVLARMDPQLFQAAVEQAHANLMAAQGQVAKSTAQAADLARQATRSKTLRDQKLIAQADLDTAQANADAAKAQVAADSGAVEQARAQLHQSEVNLKYTTIVSPTNGTVISRAVDVGQTVAASLQAPTLFTIAEDLRKMQVDTNVAEADVGKIRAKMGAGFTVDAYPTDQFRGTIRQIRNAPQTVQNVVTYDAVIDVDNGDLRLKPGMTANVTFIYAEKDDVLKVANAALRFRPPPELLGPKVGAGAGAGAGAGSGSGSGSGKSEARDRRTVWRLNGGAPKPVVVRIGVSDGTSTEIVDGDLHPGDALVTESIGSKEGGGQANPFRRMF
jgi:HlyD family secretion protein